MFLSARASRSNSSSSKGASLEPLWPVIADDGSFWGGAAPWLVLAGPLDGEGQLTGIMNPDDRFRAADSAERLSRLLPLPSSGVWVCAAAVQRVR